MKTADVDILIHPGLFGGSNSHWYARWAEKLATASQIEQDDWAAPDRESWISKLVATVDQAERPVVLIGHSLGVITIAHAAAQLTDKNVKGAFLAAPPDLEANLGEFAQTQTFLPIPRDPLPFPSYLIVSRTDPYGNYEMADDLGAAWGSAVYDAGDSGHINDDSGHGPWPEGLLMFARLLKQL